MFLFKKYKFENKYSELKNLIIIVESTFSCRKYIFICNYAPYIHATT